MSRSERTFSGGTDEVAAARQFARRVSIDWGREPEDVVLVVSELAANAVRHAQSGFTVRLSSHDTTLVVEVTDASPIPAAMSGAGPSATRGRGLVIVDRLARAWGTRPTPEGGKTVWAELDGG